MKKAFLSLSLLVHVTVFAQVSISFPVNRAIFQRNASNTGLIPIGGTFQARVERIDARLTPINGGTFVDWTPIAINPNFGTFIGGLYAQAGWYKLEIRALRGENIVGTTSLEKVGVGEVFVISGQSNAQGYEGRGNPPAIDDRVNCITNFYSYGQTTEPPFPVISQISENVKIAPFGNGSWCWGKLGDLLVEKLNVPILFINSGFEAMGIEAWRKSADGERGQDFYSGNFALPGYPYENLKKSLHYYINMFGLRTVLWHQGETDNDKRTSTEKYRQDLEYVIYRSRIDTGKEINWMISRASRVSSGTYQPVIDAQNLVIQNYSNAFEGPATDEIRERSDGVHFFGNGLIELARAWNDKLNSSFFSRSSPIPPSIPLFFDLRCSPENTKTPIRIFMPDGFKEYYWTNGFSDIAKSASIETTTGFYRGRAIDYLGNVYYTPTANYTSLGIRDKPKVSAEGNTTFCEGESVRLTSDVDQDIFWNTGESSKTIVVSQQGNYTVSQVNYLGCFTSSNGIEVQILPKPEIKVAALGETIFCADKSVTLSSNRDNGNKWNNGELSKEITVTQSGDYFVTAKNEFGCENTSSKIAITVNPLPQKPIITPDGPTEFCADKSLTLLSNVENGIKWNTGEQNNSLKVANSGVFFVRAKNEFGCETVSDEVKVTVNPLPEKPIITANGPTFFCDGQNVTLAATENKAFQWSNAKTTQTQIVNTSGLFSVKTIDQNGCISPLSDAVEVIVKPNPQGLSILQSGTYTLESITNGLFDNQFEWFKDDIKLSNENNLIKAKEAGVYKVKGSLLYQLKDGKSLRCYSEPSMPYKFNIDLSNKGVTIFPNPVPKGILNIETLDDLKDASVSIYDLKGLLIREYLVDVFDSRKSFNLSDFPKGNFLVGVKAKDFNVIKRVYIE